MNFALLWMDALVVGLLWVAAFAAFIGRIRRRWIRWVLIVFICPIPLSNFVSFTAIAAGMKFAVKVEPNWFTYALSLTVAYVVGMIFILRRGRSRAPGLPPVAATWPRGMLVFAWIVSVAVGCMTLLNIDLVIRARCAIQSVKINSLYVATLPAITSYADNAVPLYEKAFEKLKEAKEEEALVNNPPTGNAEWEDFNPDEPATIAFLNHQAATLDLLRRAAALPACRFDHDLGDVDMETMLPALNEQRNAVNVLALDASEELARGHVSKAIADTNAILRMSRHFGPRPLLVSGLVAIGMGALGDRMLEDVLPAVKSGEELSSLHLDNLAPMGQSLQQALYGEEKFGLAVMVNMPDGWEQSPSVGRNGGAVGEFSELEKTHLLSPSEGLGGAFYRAFFLDLDTEAYIDLMTDFQRYSTQPYFEIRDKAATIESEARKHGVFTSLLVSSLSHVFGPCARVEAQDRCARIAVAMTRFRLDHGKLPDRLAELVPAYLEEIPLDPFDGQPLRLAVNGDGRVIYSVGPNLKDDGGVDDHENHGKRDDVIFTLKAAPKSPTTRP